MIEAHEIIGLGPVTEEEYEHAMREAAVDMRRAALLALLAGAENAEEMLAMVADALAFVEERKAS